MYKSMIAGLAAFIIAAVGSLAPVPASALGGPVPKVQTGAATASQAVRFRRHFRRRFYRRRFYRRRFYRRRYYRPRVRYYRRRHYRRRYYRRRYYRPRYRRYYRRRGRGISIRLHF